ncbi:MAG: O-antigen ligase family protein [Maricaulaceae bacterium]
MTAVDQHIHVQPVSTRRRINSFIVLFFLMLTPALAHAGGLGMAPLAAIIGGVGWLTVTPLKGYRPATWMICLLVFLLWAGLTSLWSPYTQEFLLSNPFKLIIGVCLFVGTIKAIAAANNHRPRFLRTLFWIINLLMCGLIIIDSLSGYGLTFLVDPIRADQDVNRRLASAEMNLGHSVTILLLFLGVMATSLIQQVKYGWMLATLYFGLLMVVSYLAGLAVGLLCTILIFITLIASKFAPVLTLKVAIFAAFSSILFAPIIQWLLPFLPVEKLPLSWEHRVAMWDYTANRIWEAPIWGHGFDAVRTFDDTMKLGLADEWPIVSLHPHNAGLHIWVETGVIGAVLASLTIFILGRRAVEIAQRSNDFAMACSSFTIAVTIISVVTYGVWQHWWWASSILAISMIFTCHASKLRS